MRVRTIDKRSGLVEVNEGGRDKSYRLYAGQLTVSFSIEKKNKATGRKVRMHRTLDPNGKKATEIAAILATT